MGDVGVEHGFHARGARGAIDPAHQLFQASQQMGGIHLGLTNLAEPLGRREEPGHVIGLQPFGDRLQRGRVRPLPCRHQQHPGKQTRPALGSGFFRPRKIIGIHRPIMRTRSGHFADKLKGVERGQRGCWR